MVYSEDEMYYDGLGYLRSPGESFYDGEGYLRYPGEEYYDYDGYLRYPGDDFYDFDGYLRYPGEDFIDGEGHLRSSGGETTYGIGAYQGRSLPLLARESKIPAGKISNYSFRRTRGTWDSWDIVFITLIIIGIVIMTCRGPAWVIFF